MDIIHRCLGLAPVPYLSHAFSVFQFIWSSVQQAQASKRQLESLSQSIAQLLCMLDGEYGAKRLLEVKTSTPLADLRRLLDEIFEFVQKEVSRVFLNLLFNSNQRISQIEEFHRRITISASSFQISASLDIRTWQANNDDARAVDRRELYEHLADLEGNQQRLMETLGAHQENMMAMMVSLERRIQTGAENRERQFFTHALRYLTTYSGRQVEVEDWMITSYEVEFKCKIGSGGFGQVFEGSWNKTNVALKVLVMDHGVAPSSTSIHNEIKVWSKIRHPNVLQFLGANILDEKPFIVMPYMRNGNSRDYLQQHPNSDRLQILHGISLGLVHLHSLQIVHGDLKALNVLIDDGGKSVLCDFGLSRVKADATSRIARQDGGVIVGSRNWMAPERLRGGALKAPSDIYSFGMTLHEIFTNETPLGELTFGELVELVVRQDIRPERPDEEEAPQLSDAIWEVAEKCWRKDPKQRPTASTLCDTLSHLLNTATTRPPKPISTPSPPIILPQEIPGPSSNFPDTTAIARADPSPPAAVAPPHVSVQASPSRPFTHPVNLTLRHSDPVHCATFSPDGKYVVSGSRGGAIQVWDAQTGNLTLGPLKMHNYIVCCVAFAPNGRQIASGSGDGNILVWDVMTGKVVARPFSKHTKAVFCISFSPDGKQIASGSGDTKIRIWDAQTGDVLIGPLTGGTSSVVSVAFSGDGQRIVSSSTTLRVWDAKSGRLVHGSWERHEMFFKYVTFSPDGTRIVSAKSGDVSIWDAGAGALVFGPSKQHAEGTLASVFTADTTHGCAVSPDGQWIAAVANSARASVVNVWDSKNGSLEVTFTEHTEFIWSISFSPDSKRILSASRDKTVRVRTLDL